MTDHGPTASTVADDAPLAVAIGELDLPRHLLDDLAAEPDHTGELLMDFATNLYHSGHGERARRLLEAVREHHPASEDRQYASVELVMLLRRSQDTRDLAEADRITSELLRPGGMAEGPAEVLGENLRDLERWDEALRCFNIASRQLLAEPPEDLADEDDLSLAPLVSRLLVRMRLGLERDAHDEVALAVAQRQVEGLTDFPGEEGGDWGDEGPDGEVEPIYSREAFDGARARGLLTGEIAEHGADTYYRAVERALREQDRERPGTRWSVVLHGVGEIVEFAERSGQDPASSGTALDWVDLELSADDPRLRAWPPGRNEPCWCASGRKYKKCCGSPSNR
ncbi:zinc-binding protein [Nocardiopsis sp. TSRI0078]|uniref:SEC-C domain-containing protein n=1 Tax=unclassified Nocardiopsis TaxID=2649073 RepID=UPI00093A9E0E|nr:SEC-C domain-containing protein [Nocardiopsis sp. TSRI0078]OKI17253.1 zinc-binding protein [Nocardiopsis sp. TSRI0078]